ncbi:hypothetical protein BDP81DRAFT_413509 [Colletotrichum phormii]|uniref:Uncharacterized protein n=1 Tax=Colletotrichum phormii TaxID=359342 RepID=A0AAJ0A4L4_9PEZI|nr:uncharacterized protein BDP81DRAFT_413509 [Colletotrichum phormii]KAK1655808.1 hypothetical protein BDP81DRAFT_413509 [Colletotrichum phormii]
MQSRAQQPIPSVFPFMNTPCHLWPREIHPARPCEHLTWAGLSVTCRVLSTTIEPQPQRGYNSRTPSGLSTIASAVSCVTSFEGERHMELSGAWARSSLLSMMSRVAPFDKTEFRLLQGCRMLCLRRQAVSLSTRSWHTRCWASLSDLRPDKLRLRTLRQRLISCRVTAYVKEVAVFTQSALLFPSLAMSCEPTQPLSANSGSIIK